MTVKYRQSAHRGSPLLLFGKSQKLLQPVVQDRSLVLHLEPLEMIRRGSFQAAYSGFPPNTPPTSARCTLPPNPSTGAAPARSERRTKLPICPQPVFPRDPKKSGEPELTPRSAIYIIATDLSRTRVRRSCCEAATSKDHRDARRCAWRPNRGADGRHVAISRVGFAAGLPGGLPGRSLTLRASSRIGWKS